MIFESHSLNPVLAEYVTSVFHYRDFMPDHFIERVVPTGHIFIIFELDGMKRHTFDNETLKPNGTFTKVWISGMHKHYISISAHPKSEMLVIQFNAFGAYPFFHMPVCELNDQILPAEEVLGNEILDLREQILQPKTSIGKFELVEKWLHRRFHPDKVPPQELRNMIHQLQTESALRHSKINGNYPNSQKHLIDQFKKYVGLTPKYYQRVLRFNEILGHINRKQKINWPQVADTCGYTDQSHFIKEFKHFSGFNPTEFITNEFHQDEANFFPLDRDS